MTRHLLFVTVLVLAGAASLQAAEKLSLVSFLVVRDYNGKPVRNASVVMHPVDEGKQKRNGLELKADGEGRASFDGLPYGKWRVQVLAQGLQTYGEDYDITQPEVAITVKLKKPQEQYSIYRDNPGDKPKADSKDGGKDAGNDAGKGNDAPKDKDKDKDKSMPDATKPQTDGAAAPKN